MNIKTRLTIGVSCLFLLIILLGAVGVVYLYSLKTATQNILSDNYQTLEYTRGMLEALEDTTRDRTRKLTDYVNQQEANITEIGEAELTADLRQQYNRYLQDKANPARQHALRQTIFKIMEINMHAIARKSRIAESAADTATFWITTLSITSFMIGFLLLLNLPASISKPIRELSESIRQIAEKNYGKRLPVTRQDEFGDVARSFNIMAEQLESYNNSSLAQLMTEKQRVEALIQNMHDPVIGLDERYNVVFANEEALKITGLNKEQAIGHSAKDLALHNDLIRKLIQSVAVNGTPKPVSDTMKIFADNKESYFEQEVVPIGVQSAQGIATQIGHVIILRNVTAYKELDVAKTNFIATVSHEFKTPIASIKMGLQLLNNRQTGSLNKEQKGLLTGIGEDADRLLSITGELLNMTQVESGNIQLNLHPVNPKEILFYAISANKMQAEQKNINFELNIPEQLPDVLADSDKTAWVLTNLISNAIRYSYDHASVDLSIEMRPKQICFHVKDSGQGIQPEYRDKIFDRYFRVPGSKKEGTGLGLAISKEFIEAQGGTISVESEFGSGSTFTVILEHT